MLKSFIATPSQSSREPTIAVKSATDVFINLKALSEEIGSDTDAEPSDLFVLVNHKEKMKQRLLAALRLALLGGLVLGIVVFLGFLLGSDSVQTDTVSVLRWLEQLPWYLSAGITVLLYAGALLLFCPGTPFNLAAGFLYNLWVGWGVALGGCILGATVAFIFGRTIAREWVKSKMESKPKFKAVDWAIQKKGIYIVFLSRLSPLFPFPLLNYAFGITKIKWWQYFIGTTLGVTPGTLGYCYLGTLMRDLTDMWTTNNSDNPNVVWLSIGGSVTVVSIILISWITQRAISKATREYELLHNEKGADIEMGEKSLDPK